ncbi:MAG TPA: SDR family oxidoreductase [Candidatus Acidoferrales bacterium]|nr:SDR family oxidoreductase [Candidatus Acidoferrales bacterium]
MKSKKRRIAMTGATGLLGRNLIFELLKRHLSRLEELEIFVFGRADSLGVSLQDRLRRILLSDGFAYLGIRQDLYEPLLSRLSTVIRCVELDFDCENHGLAGPSLQELQARPIDWFFHLAGLTDFRSTPGAVAALRRVNVEGTHRLLALLSDISVREFCYVSTAYVCGGASGRIQPGVVNPSAQFRNPYERSKFEAEMLVRQFAARTGTRCRYFRPSTICGRLLEPPWGAVCKFDVFYAWAAFLLRLKRQQTGIWDAAEPGELDLRICYNRASGLNIVPADYAAKVICSVCEQGDAGESYHLVNNAETAHELYIPQMVRAVGVAGVTQVSRIPEDQNRQEKFYYKSVGASYTPYITCEEMRFDAANLQQVLSRDGLSCPAVGRREFALLMAYAIEHDFGLKNSPRVSPPEPSQEFAARKAGAGSQRPSRRTVTSSSRRMAASFR